MTGPTKLQDSIGLLGSFFLGSYFGWPADYATPTPFTLVYTTFIPHQFY